MKAIWNNTIIADSEDIILYDNVPYFPKHSLKEEYFKRGAMKSACPHKGETLYYDIDINGRVNQNAAWYYSSPLPEVSHLRDYIAFWRGVEISE